VILETMVSRYRDRLTSAYLVKAAPRPKAIPKAKVIKSTDAMEKAKPKIKAGLKPKVSPDDSDTDVIPSKPMKKGGKKRADSDFEADS